jgi:hypothetical protein
MVLLIDLFVFVRPPWRLRLIWLLGVSLWGPFGLMAYWISWRRVRQRDPQGISAFRRALYASIDTTAGYAMAMLVAIFYFVVVSDNADLWAVLLGAYLVTLFIDLIFSRAPFVQIRSDHGFAQVLRSTLLVQATTINLGFAGMLPVFALAQNHWYPAELPPAAFSTPLFWTMIPLSTAAGVLFILPFYVLLCARAHDAALPRVAPVPAAGQTGPQMPPLKGLCLAFVLSLVLMLGLIVLTMQALPH